VDITNTGQKLDINEREVKTLLKRSAQNIPDCNGVPNNSDLDLINTFCSKVDKDQGILLGEQHTSQVIKTKSALCLRYLVLRWEEQTTYL